jgi:hypothetical protein
MLASAKECVAVWSPHSTGGGGGQLDAFLSAAQAIQVYPGCLIHIWMNEELKPELKPGIVTALSRPGTTAFTIDAMLLEDEYHVRSVAMSRVVGFHLSEERMLHQLHQSDFDRSGVLAQLRGKAKKEAPWADILPTLWTAKDREAFTLAMKR